MDNDPKNQRHIKDPKHNWDKVIKGPVSWQSIRKIIEKVMKNGTESRHKEVYKRVLQVADKTVTVTFRKMSDTVWRISTAWIN